MIQQQEIDRIKTGFPALDDRLSAGFKLGEFFCIVSTGRTRSKKIIHTMGVYCDGSRKHNGVPPENLTAHIDYNITFRPGRAFFVAGVCVHKGYLSDETCKLIEEDLARNPVVMSKDTAPYQ